MHNRLFLTLPAVKVPELSLLHLFLEQNRG